MASKMNADMFGWELLYALAQRDVSTKTDVLVVLVHWQLVKCGMRCLGTGDDKVLLQSERGAEVLPDGWNANETYSLRYVYKKELHMLRAVRSEGDIIFNLLRVSDLSLSNVTFNVEETVASTEGSIEQLMPGYSHILKRIQNELISQFMDTNREVTTQTLLSQQAHPYSQNTEIIFVRPPRNAPDRLEPGWDSLGDPLAVGRSDLDPLSPGGGMIFHPFGVRGGSRQPPDFGIPGGLPRGSVPPGARFDPFGPPGVGPGPGSRPGFSAPDPDHLPPPGYDDMFM